jgi:hypothetical protein
MAVKKSSIVNGSSKASAFVYKSSKLKPVAFNFLLRGM